MRCGGRPSQTATGQKRQINLGNVEFAFFGHGVLAQVDGLGNSQTLIGAPSFAPEPLFFGKHERQ
jgi:hypothetical protein